MRISTSSNHSLLLAPLHVMDEQIRVGKLGGNCSVIVDAIAAAALLSYTQGGSPSSMKVGVRRASLGSLLWCKWQGSCGTFPWTMIGQFCLTSAHIPRIPVLCPSPVATKPSPAWIQHPCKCLYLMNRAYCSKGGLLTIPNHPKVHTV